MRSRSTSSTSSNCIFFFASAGLGRTIIFEHYGTDTLLPCLTFDVSGIYPRVM